MRRLTEDGAEAPTEMGLGEVGDTCHGAHVERLRVRPVHGVAGAEESPVQVLDFAAHTPTLRQMLTAPYAGLPCTRAQPTLGPRCATSPPATSPSTSATSKD